MGQYRRLGNYKTVHSTTFLDCENLAYFFHQHSNPKTLFNFDFSFATCSFQVSLSSSITPKNLVLPTGVSNIWLTIISKLVFNFFLLLNNIKFVLLISSVRLFVLNQSYNLNWSCSIHAHNTLRF